jgi:hypothetical protein
LFRFNDKSSRVPWLAVAFPDLLRIELASPEIRIVPEDVAHRCEYDLGLDRAEKLSRKTLSSIRRLTGADLVITGSYTVVDDRSGARILQLAVRIHDTLTGRLIEEQKTVAPDLSEAATKAGDQIRAALHLARPGALETERAALPGTEEGSEAYYSGLSKLHSFDEKGERDSLEKAVTLEPGSARVHSALAGAWTTLRI